VELTGRAATTRSEVRRTAAAMAEPLPLSLPVPSPFPGRVGIEAAVPCEEPFDHPDWRFSVDWDGSRALLFASADGRVRLQGETLADITDRFPELKRAAAGFAGHIVVLDGVVGVLDPEGRPDLRLSARRLALGPDDGADLPAVYLATDLLYFDGVPALTWPLDHRLDALTDLVGDSEVVQVPDHVEARGRALAEAASARGLAALIARRNDAPYHPGVFTRERLRIPLHDRTTCVVAALTMAAPRRSRGIVLAEQDSGRLAIAGWVPAPDDRVISGWLERRAAGLATASPLLDAPAQGASVRWLRPELTGTVRHNGRHRDGTLRDPELVALRDDCDPLLCVRRDPIPAPPILDDHRGFTPTILMPLPMDDAVTLPHAPR